MTWTYNIDLSTDKDKVRVRIGDTNTNAQLLSDEEINALFSAFSSDLTLTVVGSIRAIIGKLARDYDRSNLGMSAQRSQQIQHYKDLLAEYMGSGVEGMGARAEMFVGGLSRATEESFDTDTDYKGPDMRRGLDDNPGGTGTGSGVASG